MLRSRWQEPLWGIGKGQRSGARRSARLCGFPGRLGSLAPDPHLLFPYSHAGPTDVILTNKFTVSALKGGPDRPHTSPKHLPALKSGNGVSGYPSGAGQITHALWN
jgi:hypothetical protein